MAYVGRVVDNALIERVEIPEGVALEDLFPAALGFEVLPDGAEVGMVRKGKGFAPAPPPVILPPVPQSVHAYQFAGQAAAESIITADEGKAWAGAGTIPASLQAAVDKLITDPAAHDRVTFFLVGATDFPRYNDNTVALGALFGKDTPEKLDAFFVAAGQR